MRSKFFLAALAGVVIVLFCTVIKRNEGRLKPPPGSRAPIVMIGDSHGLVLAPDGSLWTWGGQDRGWPVLGLGKKESTDKLIQIGSETNWVSASAGSDHGLRATGQTVDWNLGHAHGLVAVAVLP